MTWQHLNSLGVALQLRDRLAINIFIAFLSEDFVVNFSKMKAFIMLIVHCFT